MMYPFNFGRKSLELFANRLKTGWGFGIVFTKWMLRIGIGWFVVGAELVTRGNCEDCFYYCNTTAPGEQFCFNSDSRFENQHVTPGHSCECWGK